MTRFILGAAIGAVVTLAGAVWIILADAGLRGGDK